MRFDRYIVLLLLTACITGAAGAQAAASKATASKNDNFVKLVSGYTEQQYVLQVAKRTAAIQYNPCPSATYAILNSFVFYVPVQFDSNGNMTKGVWKQSVKATGCGKQWQLNVLLGVDVKDHRIRGVPLMPGDTHADPVLQKDAIRYALLAAEMPEKNCKTGYIDTQFLKTAGKPLKGVKGKPWDEAWALTTCTKKAQVIMHFIPDKTGTTIKIDKKETKFWAR